jgi:hypothetical protein
VLRRPIADPGMAEMASSAVLRRSNSPGCHLGGLPAVTEGLGHGGQHTTAVATTVMCWPDLSSTVDRHEQHVTATAAAMVYC